MHYIYKKLLKTEILKNYVNLLKLIYLKIDE